MGKSLCEIVLVIVHLIQTAVARMAQATRQADRDRLHNDPARWFDAHFGGLSERDTENETSETHDPD